ncbi:stress up-regulated Nod 19 protein [Perilla frutescens var. hirtella]|uniref:Stress up-regulated Nod 19 protein n=1 Tax=Perilla frutescens var. hirtella TaxID=608512 RepID=A0AAD4IN04_PERFH|nr:stress up-regulated Nod 19 protein [Perilla frutescens var. hirtella]
MQKIVSGSEFMLLCLAILLLSFKAQCSQPHLSSENGMKTDVFLSPKFELEPGSVSNKYYYGIDFPRGHIAIKRFDAEVVDEEGNPVPLHETYLHHWVVVGYYIRKGQNALEHHGDMGLLQSDFAMIRNSGVCDHGLVQYFGLGSETRRTATDVPDPYGIEVGNPADVPAGFEERWMLNVHAIDTRGAEDKLGCTECRCDLYNVTMDEYGYALPPDYNGGLKCCHDEARCRVKEGFPVVKRSLYLRYTVTYMDWDASIIPVQIYIFDVTDIYTKADVSRGLRAKHHCLIEYDVESCPIGAANDDCIHTKSVTVGLPIGGDVIYGVGHQHSGGLGSTLYGEGGRVICSSVPTYGMGDEPGNEAGYIVGMSTCYPSPGSVKISAGEKLTVVSNYSNAQRHTGVMGLFYILIADSSMKSNAIPNSPADVDGSMAASSLGWAIALFGVGFLLALVLIYNGKYGRDEGYEEV